MPYPIAHPGYSILPWLRWRRLPLLVLIVAGLVPDLENPFLFILTQGRLTRLTLHSIPGAFFLDPMLSISLSYVMLKLSRRKSPKFIQCHLPGYPQLFRQFAFNTWTILAALIGSLTHVTADILVPHYQGQGSPLWFPFSTKTVSFYLFSDPTLSKIIVNSVGVFLFLISLPSLLRRE